MIEAIIAINTAPAAISLTFPAATLNSGDIMSTIISIAVFIISRDITSANIVTIAHHSIGLISRINPTIVVQITTKKQMRVLLSSNEDIIPCLENLKFVRKLPLVSTISIPPCLQIVFSFIEL